VKLQYIKYVYVDEFVMFNTDHTLLLMTWQFCRDDLTWLNEFSLQSPCSPSVLEKIQTYVSLSACVCVCLLSVSPDKFLHQIMDFCDWYEWWLSRCRVTYYLNATKCTNLLLIVYTKITHSIIQCWWIKCCKFRCFYLVYRYIGIVCIMI
jgi:hypothetical protein